MIHPHWNAIAAMADGNRVIGKNGTLPWHLPEDFRWFKKTTMGKAIVMGRKTYESLGKPLPGRRNVVMTRGEIAGDVEVVRSLEGLMQLERQNDVWVIGGAEIYRLLLPACGWLYLSHVHGEWEGDAFFPPFEEDFSFERIIASHEKFDVRLYRNRLMA